MTKADVLDNLLSTMKENDVPFDTNKAVRGVRPDAIVTAPDGRRIVIEAKAWRSTRESTRRAALQAKLYLWNWGQTE